MMKKMKAFGSQMKYGADCNMCWWRWGGHGLALWRAEAWWTASSSFRSSSLASILPPGKRHVNGLQGKTWNETCTTTRLIRSHWGWSSSSWQYPFATRCVILNPSLCAGMTYSSGSKSMLKFCSPSHPRVVISAKNDSLPLLPSDSDFCKFLF